MSRRRRRRGSVLVVAPTLTLQPDAATGVDTFIDTGNANTNYGTSTLMPVGDSSAVLDRASRPLIKFDLSSVPSNATITAATLSLYESHALHADPSPASWAVTLHRVLVNWVETEATWNIYSTGNNWNTAGCGGDGTDRVADASASVTLDGTAALAFIDWAAAGAIADVQAWVSGSAPNYGWLVLSAGEFQGVEATSLNTFNTSDHATASQRPKLTLDYTYYA